MFPIPWNFPFRKKDGTMSTISAEMGGDIPPATADKLGGVKVGSGLSVTSDGTLSGVNELPSHTISEAGKVLTVGDDGSLEWDESGAGGGYWFDRIRPMLCFPTTVDNVIRVEYGGFPNPPTNGVKLSHGYTTNVSTTFPLIDCIDFSISSCIELQNYITDAMATLFNASLIGSLIEEPGTSLELNSPLTNYDVIIIQGVYNTDGSGSQYDVSMLYKDVSINTAYWFGVMDRNSNYCGSITFTDATHATLSASRRIKIYGFNL